MMGPGMAYGLGGLMLRLYVDIDRMPEGEPQGHTAAPRGTWLLANCLLVSQETRSQAFQVQIPAILLTLDMFLNLSFFSSLRESLSCLPPKGAIRTQ